MRSLGPPGPRRAELPALGLALGWWVLAGTEPAGARRAVRDAAPHPGS